MKIFTWLQESALARWVGSAPTLLAYPTILTLHTAGMSIVAGTCAVIDLPHVNFLLDVKEPDGSMMTWTLVHAGPNQMRAAGLSDRDFWQVGKIYMASLALARNGSPRGYVFTIKTPDDKLIYLTFGNVGVDPLNKDGLGNGRPTKFQ